MLAHKVKLIVNPNAGLGSAWRAARDLRPVVEELGGADWTGTVYPTHATELARQAGEAGYELVVAAGGDGTVHEVINGLMQVPEDRRPRLGVVPIGSGNDFSHAIGINPDPFQAMRQAYTGQPRRVDLGCFHDGRGQSEYFSNAIGIGFDTKVTVHTRKIPVLHGFPVFLASVIYTILLAHDAPRLKIVTDRESFEEAIILLVLCNGSREGGGFFVSPASRPDDGQFDFVYIRDVSRLMMFRLLPEVMKGTHLKFPQVRSGAFKRLELHADRPLYIHTDGEIFAGPGVDIRHLVVENIPAAIEVMV